MGDITSTLDGANRAYDASKLAIIEARVDVKFADITSDAEVRQLILRATVADGRPNGPIVKAIAPDGQTPLTKPFGQAQVDVLIHLEDTLQALTAAWPQAAAEKATIAGLRASYEAALQGRKTAWQAARGLRKARDLARQAFVKGYNEISLGVKALYVDDKRMVELFFDDVENDVEKDIGAEEEAPADPAPAP